MTSIILRRNTIKEERGRSRGRGLTILEILVVLSVLAILIGLAMPTIKGMQDQAGLNRANSEIQAIQLALESYYLTHSSYPSNITTDLINDTPQILSETLKDPFSPTGSTYQYLRSNNGIYYVLWSVGMSGSAQPTSISDTGDISY